MKVYLKYDESDKEELHMTIKLKLPKKWVPGPVLKLKEVSNGCDWCSSDFSPMLTFCLSF